jgi:hypothetical protein
MSALPLKADIQDGAEVAQGRIEHTVAVRASITLVLSQCKSIGRSLGKRSDIRTKVFVSRKNRRGIDHDKDLCISVWL